MIFTIRALHSVVWRAVVWRAPSLVSLVGCLTVSEAPSMKLTEQLGVQAFR